MVEHAAARKGVAPPAWVRDVEPLESPVFASDLHSLRAHLLRASPAAFRRRNLFVDSTVGDPAARVAARAGVPERWLNDAVKGFPGPRNEFERFLELPHLRVFVAHPRYLPAMRRPSPS